jgi:hypothetical protein
MNKFNYCTRCFRIPYRFQNKVHQYRTGRLKRSQRQEYLWPMEMNGNNYVPKILTASVLNASWSNSALHGHPREADSYLSDQEMTRFCGAQMLVTAYKEFSVGPYNELFESSYLCGLGDRGIGVRILAGANILFILSAASRPALWSYPMGNGSSFAGRKTSCGRSWLVTWQGWEWK